MNTLKTKQLLLDQLRKTPIVQIAAEKIGVGRATYYRWRKEDKKFLKDSDQAIFEGNLLINDMAESQLISAIKDKNITSIIFWLKNHHKDYANRIEISTQQNSKEELTPEQEKLIEKALLILRKEKDEKGIT